MSYCVERGDCLNIYIACYESAYIYCINNYNCSSFDFSSIMFYSFIYFYIIIIIIIYQMTKGKGKMKIGSGKGGNTKRKIPSQQVQVKQW